jgi:hypothetical protein
MKPALKAPLRSLVYYCYQVSDSYEATFYYCYQVSDGYEATFYYCGQNSYCHYDAQNRRNRRQEFYDGFDCH